MSNKISRGDSKAQSILRYFFPCCTETSFENDDILIDNKESSHVPLLSEISVDQTVDRNKSKLMIRKRSEKLSLLFKKNICNCQSLKEKNKKNERANFKLERINENKKISVEKKTKLAENFRLLNSLCKYKKNEIFFLKYNLHAILCKLTYQNFKFPTLKTKKQAQTKSLIKLDDKFEEEKKKKEFDEKKNMFTLFHQGIRLDSEGFEKTLAEKICQYFAKKIMKNSVVLDGFCGIGAASIQFALENHTVISMENDEKKLNMAINNFNVYKVKSRIDLMHYNFVETCMGIKPVVDLVFLYPNYDSFNITHNDKFCLFSNVFPDVRKILDVAMSITENIILILPKTLEIEELALLLSDFFESYQSIPISNSIEIECLTINNKIEKFAVLIGNVKTISIEDEKKFVMNYLNLEKNNSFNEIGIFLNYIIEKIGIFITCQNILEAETSLEEQKTETLFQIFLEKLYNKKMIKKEELLEYLNTEKIRDYFRKKRGERESNYKDQSYTFNPLNLNSLDKSVFYSSKSYKNEITSLDSHILDLKDENQIKIKEESKKGSDNSKLVSTSPFFEPLPQIDDNVSDSENAEHNDASSNHLTNELASMYSESDNLSQSENKEYIDLEFWNGFKEKTSPQKNVKKTFN